MNERYLFRGKRKDNNEWVDGYLIQGNRTYIVTIEAINYMVVSTSCMASIELVEVIPETVGQCTDLKDKNGKLIFESDVVKLTDTTHNQEWKACVVFGNPYGTYNWGWNLMYTGKEPDVNTDILLWIEMQEACVYCEVIGNIHDNPNSCKIEHDSLCETETYKAGDAE